MISRYLRQTAQWKKMISEDGYPPQPGEPTEIRVRWEGKRRLVRDNEGREVVSEARVFCTAEVNPGDVLEYGGRDWPVIAVADAVGVDGQLRYREASV